MANTKSPVTGSNAKNSPKSANKSMVGSKSSNMRNCGCQSESASNWSSNAKKNMQATGSQRKMSAEFAQEQCKLSDQEIISDVLGSHKALVKLYGTALCESSCPQLRDLVNSQMTECAQDQFDAFLYMNERGMYPTDNAPLPKITQAKKKFTKCEQTMRK